MSFSFDYEALNKAVFLSDGVLPIDDIYKYYKGF